MMKVNLRMLGTLAVVTVALSSLFMTASGAGDAVASTSFEEKIVDDWKLQESHLDRTIASPEALNDLVEHLEGAVERLAEEELCDADKIEDLRAKIAETKALDLTNATEEEREAAYCALRWQGRETLFTNSLFKNVPLIFIKGKYFGFQVLQEPLSCYARFANLGGGGVFRLENPGFSFDSKELTSDFPVGHYSTLNMSYDAKSIYFSYADFSKWYDPNAPRLDMKDLIPTGWYNNMSEYLKETDGKYHLFKMNLETGETVQLTDGPFDDIDGNEAPDGSLVFISTRRKGFARCNGWHEPIQVETLHKLLPDGKIVPLSWHETNEWTPTFMRDGRILYTRWDYVDRSASSFQGLWWTNPDGTSASSIFGSYTEDIRVCIQPEQIPNSEKIMFLAAAHHLGTGGSVVILDPNKIRYNPETGLDDMSAVECVTPDVFYPETPATYTEDGHPMIPQTFYFSPYPFSEDFYYVSYSHEQLGGYLKTHGADSHETLYQGKLGLYYRDRFGNLELMFEDDEYDCRYPTPILEREVPAVIASKIPEADADSDYGTFNLVNVYDSVFQMPKDRPIKELRIFQILPKAPGHAGDNPKIGHDFAGNARMFLGTVPVDEDGSAYFKAPSRKPLYFQAVDESGRAVQTMLSEVYLQPGENRGCVGCHEQLQSTADNADQRRSALNRAPSEIQPGPRGTKPFSYPILVQPILERACVSCHGVGESAVAPQLTGDPNGQFTTSYQNLKPYIRWYEWDRTRSIRFAVSFPGECGADMSPLTKILEDENHKDKVNLTDQERRNLYLWLDANIPFYGTFVPGEVAKQQNGEEIAEPDFQ